MVRVSKFIVYRYLNSLLASHLMKLLAVFIKTRNCCYLLWKLSSTIRYQEIFYSTQEVISYQSLFQKMFLIRILDILWQMIRKKLKGSLTRKMIESMKEIPSIFLIIMIRLWLLLRFISLRIIRNSLKTMLKILNLICLHRLKLVLNKPLRRKSLLKL